MKLSHLREEAANMQSLHDLRKFEEWMGRQPLMQEELDVLGGDIARHRELMKSKGM